VLYGDPTKPRVFVTRVKFSAGWKDMPHWHPDEVRTVAVQSADLAVQCFLYELDCRGALVLLFADEVEA
jgi:hypothetical protein